MGDRFVEERLEAATAIPPSQRSPEVAAFIECCQLQRELADEQRQGPHSTRQQQALAALKFTRSHFLSPSVPLWYRHELYPAAWNRLVAGIDMQESVVGALGKQITALINKDLSIWSVLLVTAGVPTLERGQTHLTGVLPALNSLVEKMQHPVLAARLRQELDELQANLACSLLSYDEVLAYLVFLAGVHAGDLAQASDGYHTTNADILSSLRAEVEMLPRLVPNNLRLGFVSIAAAEWFYNRTKPLSRTPVSVRQLRVLLDRAKQQGSDFIVALCGYKLVALSESYCVWGSACQVAKWHEASLQGLFAPPSAFLSFLEQARAAHARCQALLPKQWTAVLKARQQEAMTLRPWLQQQQENRETWQLFGPEQHQSQPRAGNPTGQLVRDKCNGCGNLYPDLKLCSRCKQVQYCSRECQRAHWQSHKDLCKAYTRQ